MTITTGRCVLLILNSIFWVALVLLSLLLFIHHDKELDIPISWMKSLELPFGISMIVLVVLFFTGFAGLLVVVIGENYQKVFIAIFSSMLILLTCLLTTLSYMEYTHHDEIRGEYLSQFDESIKSYNSSRSTINNSTNDDWSNDGSIYNAEDVDRIQSIMKCCGSTNYTDFQHSPWGKNHSDMAPESCCNFDLLSENNLTCRALNWKEESEFIYARGCHDIVDAAFVHWLDTLIVIQCFLVLCTIIALFGSSIWIRQYRQAHSQTEYEPLLEED